MCALWQGLGRVQRRGAAALYRVAHPGAEGTRLAAENIAAALKKLPMTVP